MSLGLSIPLGCCRLLTMVDMVLTRTFTYTHTRSTTVEPDDRESLLNNSLSAVDLLIRLK